jgi:hypothetical protein
MGHGGEIHHPLRTHFKQVFSSVGSPDRPSHPEVRLQTRSSAGTFTDLLATGHSSPISLAWRSSGNRRQGAREHLACRPSSRGSPGCHRRSSLLRALRHQLAPSLARLNERYWQGCVRTHKMRVGTPPFSMGQQVWSGLRRRPGSTSQRGSCMSDGQIHRFNESRLQPPREAQSL